MRLACKLVKLGSHPTNNEKFERPIYYFDNKLYHGRSVSFDPKSKQLLGRLRLVFVIVIKSQSRKR